jgi:hypothetical protein
VAAIVWVTTQHGLAFLPLGPKILPGETNRHVLAIIFGRTGTWFQEMVGLFGWDTVYAPLFTYLAWYVGVGTIFVLALASSRIRLSAILASLAVLVVVVPLIIEFSAAKTTESVNWHGRYTLPFAVGVPLLAAVLLDKSNAVAQFQSRLTALLCCAISLGGFLAFAEALRQYAVGLPGPLDYLHGRWSPPLGALALTIVYLIATVLFTGFLWHLGNRRLPRLEDEPALT